MINEHECMPILLKNKKFSQNYSRTSEIFYSYLLFGDWYLLGVFKWVFWKDLQERERKIVFGQG